MAESEDEATMQKDAERRPERLEIYVVVRLFFEFTGHFLEGFDVELVGDFGELVGADVAHDVDEDGFFGAVDHGHHQTLDGFVGIHFHVNADVFFFVLHGNNLFPLVGGELGANGFGALGDLRAVLLVELEDVDADLLEVLQQFGGFWFALLRDFRREGKERAFDVDLDGVAVAAVGQFAEIDVSGGLGLGLGHGRDDANDGGECEAE